MKSILTLALGLMLSSQALSAAEAALNCKVGYVNPANLGLITKTLELKLPSDALNSPDFKSARTEEFSTRKAQVVRKVEDEDGDKYLDLVLEQYYTNIDDNIDAASGFLASTNLDIAPGKINTLAWRPETNNYNNIHTVKCVAK